MCSPNPTLYHPMRFPLIRVIGGVITAKLGGQYRSSGCDNVSISSMLLLPEKKLAPRMGLFGCRPADRPSNVLAVLFECEVYPAPMVRVLNSHMSYSLNSLKGLYRGLYRGLL